MKRLRHDLEEHGLLLEWTEELLDAVDDMPSGERPPPSVLALLFDSSPDVQWEVLRHLVGEEGTVILKTSKQLAHAMRHAYHRAFWIAYDQSLKRYLAWDPWYALPGKQQPTDLVDPLYQLLHPRHGLSNAWFVRLEHEHFPALTPEDTENLLVAAEREDLVAAFRWLLRRSDKRPLYLQGSVWTRRLSPGTRLSFWSLWIEMLEQHRVIVEQGDFMDQYDESLYAYDQMENIFDILYTVWHDARPNEFAVWMLFDRDGKGQVLQGSASKELLVDTFLTRIAKKRGLDRDTMIELGKDVPWWRFWWKRDIYNRNEYNVFLLMLIEKTQPEEPQQTLENFLSPTLRLWFLEYQDMGGESRRLADFTERLKAIPFEAGEPRYSRTIEDDVLRPLSKFSPRMLYTIMKQWRGEWGLPYYHAVREELAQRLLTGMHMEEIKELGRLIESGRTRIGYVAQIEYILIHLPSARPTRRLLKILGEKGLALSPAEVDKFYNIDARDGRPILFLL